LHRNARAGKHRRAAEDFRITLDEGLGLHGGKLSDGSGSGKSSKWTMSIGHYRAKRFLADLDRARNVQFDVSHRARNFSQPARHGKNGIGEDQAQSASQPGSRRPS
jgi:hypothetical protein